MLDSIDLAIFDMDGVIFDTERLAIAAWKQAGLLLGIDVPDEAIVETIGLSAERTREVYARRLGDAFPYEAVLEERLRIGWDQVRDGAPLKENLRETLTAITERGISLAVATSTAARRAIHLLDTAELSGCFAAIVTGDQVAHTKPAPDLLLEAARRVDIPPGRCLVVEDSDYGIIAAHRAGMAPVFVKDIKEPGPEVLALATARFGDLGEFLSALD
jgi:HAD superfamily hydrolase (TIGR01509 family)